MRKDNDTGSIHPGNPEIAPDKRQHPAYQYTRDVLARALNKYFVDDAMLDHAAMEVVARLKSVGLL